MLSSTVSVASLDKIIKCKKENIAKFIKISIFFQANDIEMQMLY